MTLRPQSAFLLGLLAALAPPACSSPKGIRVDIDMAGFQATTRTLRLTVTAAPDGFVGNSPTPSDPGVSIANTDTNDLVMTFAAAQGYKFGSKVSYRLDTGNTHDLQLSAEALAFNVAGAKIASGKQSGVVLSAGGEAELAISLTADNDSTTVDTTVIDLATTAVDAMVTGPSSSAQPATVAICDVTGSNSGAVVIGVPGASSPTTSGVGAVYVVFDGASVDLGAPLDQQELHVYGVSEGDQLGAAIGCFDFDEDGADDLVISAPGAQGANNEAGAGRVYVIRGRSGLKDATIDLSQHQADVEWVGGTAGGHLGAQLRAADLQGGRHGEILIAAPGEGTGIVHLADPGPMSGAPVGPRPLSGTTGHLTFSGIAPQSIAIGDLDGDGAGGSEVIFGDPGFLDASNARVGAVTAFANVDPTSTIAFDATGMGATGPARRITGMAANDGFGAALLAINVSGQGADLIVGAPGENNGTGAVRIFEHDSQIFTAPQAPKWTITGAIAGGRFGATLAAGTSAVVSKAPLVVGAPASASGSRDAAGAVFVYKRLEQGGLPVLIEKISGAAAMDRLGAAIAAGPVGTNDDIADVVAVAPFATANPTRPNAGVAYIAVTR